MTYEAFTAEVAKAENILTAMMTYKMAGIPKVDLSVDACECAAMILGCDVTTAKMLNKRFRDDACAAAMEMMREKVAA